MKRPFRIGLWVLGGVALLLGSLFVLEHFYRGEVTIYVENCMQHAALRKRLLNAGVPFRTDERNGIVLGVVNLDEIVKKIGLQNLNDIPTDAGEVCSE